MAEPPVRPTLPTLPEGNSRTSFQRRRYSSPEKAQVDDDSPWIPIGLPNHASVDITRSSNILLVDTLGTKSKELVFLEEQDDFLSFKVFNGLKFTFSDIIVGHSFGLVATIRLHESFDQSQVSAIAVASRDSLFIYHRNSCILKIGLDQSSMSDIESDFWNQLRLVQDISEFGSLIDQIKKLTISGNFSFSYQMQKLLSMESIIQMQEYVQNNKISNSIQSHISAIDALPKRETNDELSPSIIAIGTLECEIYLLSPPKYQVSDKFQLSSAVMQIRAVGSYFGDFKIYSLCLDGCIYVISRNKCTEIIQCEKNAMHFIVSQENIFLSFQDCTIKCFNVSGQSIFTIDLLFPILHMEAFNIEHKGIFGFMVALSNKQVKIFNKRDMIFDLSLSETVSAFKFGSFKGEEMALISILKNKTVDVRVLKRSSSLSARDKENKEYGFTKKSKAYVDCLKRERMHAKGLFYARMDILSQVCLDRKLLSKYTSMPLGIDVNIEVIGLYNPFTLSYNTKNVSINPAAHLILNIQPISPVKIVPNIIKIPFLPPDTSCKSDGMLYILDDCKNVDLLCRILCKGRSKPILSTIMTIPVPKPPSFDDIEEKVQTYALKQDM